MKKPKIIRASDHAGVALKSAIIFYLKKSGYDAEDMGAKSFDKDDDYPDFIMPAAKKVAREKCLGIIFGSSGQGEAIASNKVKGIRAALYYGSNPEIIRLSRMHNDSNILSLGARFVSKKEAIEAIELWLSTSFMNEERHRRRIAKISKIEEKLCK